MTTLAEFDMWGRWAAVHEVEGLNPAWSMKVFIFKKKTLDLHNRYEPKLKVTKNKIVKVVFDQRQYT